MKNFYDILNVSSNADLSEIKREYKKLAKEYHPDRNKSPNAEEKFKEITVAYDTLKDQDKREEYDRKIRFGTSHGGNSGGRSWAFDSDLSNIFEEIKRREEREKRQNDDIADILKRNRWSNNNGQSRMKMDFNDLFKDPEDLLYKHNMKNKERQAESIYEPIPIVTFELTLEECINGTTRTFINKETKKETRINLPARVTPEDILNVKSPRIDIHIKPKFRKWKFIDRDVHINISIDKFKNRETLEIETILGEKIKIKTPTGDDLFVGKKLRLKDKRWLTKDDLRTNMIINIV